MELPKFKYHPDPIKTGSVEKSNNKCICCGKTPGYIYTGPVYAEEELENEICPWCIADGSAHDKYDAEFVDYEGIGDYGNWENVSDIIKEEISYRTPGFRGWQQERWWTHCGDGGVFLGSLGREESQALGEDFFKYLRSESNIKDDSEWIKYFNALNKDRGPTAHAFKCSKCGRLGGYSDSL